MSDEVMIAIDGLNEYFMKDVAGQLNDMATTIRIAKFLGSTNDSRAIRPLVEALEKKPPSAIPNVRLELVKSLGMIGDESAIETLRKISFNDEDGKIRREAEKGIKKIKKEAR